MAVQEKIDPKELQQYYDTTDQVRLTPGWVGRGAEGAPEIQPFLWRWAEVEPLVLKSGELVTPDRDVERRTLRLATPGLERGTTHTITAALQLLLPGECAPAHRHTPTAIRWILKGQGAYTTVEGDKCYMEPGDLILTPSWTWHDHANEGNQPMIWLDGLDVPLVRYLKANFYEQFPEDQQPIVGVGESERRYASGALRPAWEDTRVPYSPLWHYKWKRTREALAQLAQVDASPFDDVAMEFSDPAAGGPVLRTMACWIQLIRPGVRTRAHRHTSSAVYQVFRGEGYSVINGQRFDWKEGDFFALPSWAWHEHANDSRSEEAILFSIQDIPVMKALSLYREEPYEANAGHQEITGRFAG